MRARDGVTNIINVLCSQCPMLTITIWRAVLSSQPQERTPVVTLHCTALRIERRVEKRQKSEPNHPALVTREDHFATPAVCRPQNKLETRDQSAAHRMSASIQITHRGARTE